MESRVGISVTLEVVCGKWKGLILWKLLQDESLRFNALRRSLDGNISSRILARELKQLMNDGLVERIDHQTVPPHVEYRLSPYGRSTASFLHAMNQWGIKHQEEMHAVQSYPGRTGDESTS
ncbi:winged helix-turn-helix transcriptional regulator [Halobacillus litoralis]|uniref:winged helix-turn-helix transcriptional regulator n=1 Tax=Halobacillus litoralis TaxID=45668 RepID=UPI001CD26E78|nr:helix-turn-helix domain-containing protein [Halobacillus litoralis]MCA1020721.1 helix-turn-helix transcriptional regulator [Halobacillus litoralis]